MELYQLEYFLCVSEKLNYSKAAETLFVSRQALAKTVHKLEDELGGPLFSNRQGRICLTPLGQTLRQEAVPLLQAFHTFQSNMAAHTRGNPKKDILPLAFCHGVKFAIPSDFFLSFMLEYPNILIQSEEYTSQRVLQAVQDGQVDLGILGSVPSLLHGFETYHLLSTDLSVMVPESNPLSQKDFLTIEDMKDQPIVGFGPQNHVHIFYEARCREAGFEPTFSIITSDVPTALELLRQNRTLCFSFPGFRLRERDYHARLLKLVCSSDENFSTYAVTRKHVTLPPAARTFLISLQKLYRKPDAGGLSVY